MTGQVNYYKIQSCNLVNHTMLQVNKVKKLIKFSHCKNLTLQNVKTGTAIICYENNHVNKENS